MPVPNHPKPLTQNRHVLARLRVNQANFRLRLLMRAISFIVLPVILPACATTPAPPSATVESLAALMTGTFDSSQQHEADPDNFFNIRLVMTPVWEGERFDAYPDSTWLYVEQAAASALDRPYRQRVYRLTRGGSAQDPTYISSVYTLPDDAQHTPLDFAACWNDAEPLGGITPDDLVLREGCAITLRRVGDTFVGSTDGTGCSSSLGDAAYATSEVEIVAGFLTSWDRGWTAEGEHAWGSTEGPYEFVKISGGVPE